LEINPPAPTADLAPSPRSAGPDRARLRILATSDLHAHLRSWDYLKNRASPAVGLSRTASLIAKARAEVGCCILVDNGDFLQGSPLGDVEALQTRAASEAMHPMIAAMNLLRYDVVNLGNHEFSQGLEFLRQALSRAQFPAISANLMRRLGPHPLQDAALVPPSVIIHRLLADATGQVHPLRVGLVGFAPPQSVIWERAKLGTCVQGRDILEAAMAHVPRLRAQGADVVIALSHSGIGSGIPTEWVENASAALAQIAGIDALVMGHTHQTFPMPGAGSGELSGKPAVMPGFYGSHLGVMDIDLGRVDGRWQVQGARSALWPIARRSGAGRLRAVAANAPAIVKASASAHRATRTWGNRPVGHSVCALHSYFAMIGPSSAVRLVARAQAAQVSAALAGGPYAHLPVLSAAAPFHGGGRGGPDNFVDIPPGPLTLRHVYDLYPHPNTIAALLVTGAELKAWLERSFSQFTQITPGAQDWPLLDPDFPSFTFDTIEGLTWAVDLAATAWVDARGAIEPTHPPRRILDLSYQGQAVACDQHFVLATNSYRASGSGGFAGAQTKALPLGPPINSRDALAAYIAQTGPITDQVRPNWHFAPMAGTTVVFDTSPRAASHLSAVSPAMLVPLSLTPQGFRRFRLHL